MFALCFRYSEVVLRSVCETKERRTQMFKRVLLLAILALHMGLNSNHATADSPWPVCFPCPDDVR